MPPIAIPHNPQWKQRYIQEQAILRQSLGDQARAIHHIGSTSIPNILAKPIIDILIEVDSLDRLDQSSPAMESLGYEVMGEFGIETRRYFRKTNAQGVRTHHIHAFTTGSPHLLRHLAFRDYLIAHPAKAHEYSQLKADLIADPDITLDAYIAGKNAFIQRTESEALAWPQRSLDT
ncbi:MAG: GrpB family protein [Phycisphaerales bacterium]